MNIASLTNDGKLTVNGNTTTVSDWGNMEWIDHEEVVDALPMVDAVEYDGMVYTVEDIASFDDAMTKQGLLKSNS